MRLTLLLLLVTPCLAFATWGSKPPTQTQTQHQGQHQGQTQNTESISSNNVDIGNQSAANIDIKSAKNAPDIILVPQGHTSNCQRTYGISFSNGEGGAGLGWPYRDKNCDFDNEAADAFAAGQHAIGWFWNCHKKSAYKVFKRAGSNKEQAIQACHMRMMQMYVKVDDKPMRGS